MTAKTADLASLTTPKGKARSATTYPGDTPVKTSEKQSEPQASTQSALPPHLQNLTKPETRDDALNLRITATERQKITDLCKRLNGISITQTIMLGLISLENDLDRAGK